MSIQTALEIGGSTARQAAEDSDARRALADLRREFWESPEEVLHSRETVGAVVFLTVDSMESLAMKGAGPPYLRIGRRALYRKAEVLEWIAQNARRVEGREVSA
jgi:hypothetical protein